MNEVKITALYERLSVGDEQRSGESVSIQNQKLLLEQYAQRHGYRHTAHYTEIIITRLIQSNIQCAKADVAENRRKQGFPDIDVVSKALFLCSQFKFCGRISSFGFQQ